MISTRQLYAHSEAFMSELYNGWSRYGSWLLYSTLTDSEYARPLLQERADVLITSVDEAKVDAMVAAIHDLIDTDHFYEFEEWARDAIDQARATVDYDDVAAALLHI